MPRKISESSPLKSSPPKRTPKAKATKQASKANISESSFSESSLSESSLAKTRVPDSEIPTSLTPKPSIKELFTQRKAALLQKSLEAAKAAQSRPKSRKSQRTKTSQRTKSSGKRSLFASTFETITHLFDSFLSLASWGISWIFSLCLWALLAWLLWREIKAQNPAWLLKLKEYLEPLLSSLDVFF